MHTAKPSTERKKRHDWRSDDFTILDPEKGPKKWFQTDLLSTNGLPQKEPGNQKTSSYDCIRTGVVWPPLRRQDRPRGIPDKNKDNDQGVSIRTLIKEIECFRLENIKAKREYDQSLMSRLWWHGGTDPFIKSCKECGSRCMLPSFKTISSQKGRTFREWIFFNGWLKLNE